MGRVAGSRKWGLLLLTSSALGALLAFIGLPSAMLVGPMLAAMAMGLSGTDIELPPFAFVFAQAVTGCLIASTLNGGVLHTVLDNAVPMAMTVAVTLVSAGLVGAVVKRYGGLEGSTGAWGILPGAAPAMIAMSADFGGDPRMVGLMQYLRVVIVVLSTSSIAHGLAEPLATEVVVRLPAATASMAGLANHDHWNALLTVAIALVGAGFAMLVPMPAAALLFPLVIGSVASAAGLVTLHVPALLLTACFAVIGWTIGLKFRRDMIGPFLRALPWIVFAILALMAACAVSAWCLVRMTGLSPLTAYLSTSPGGLDSVAIIALGTNADIAFVMAFQTMRLFAVIIAGPLVGRLVSRVPQHPRTC